MKPLELKNGVHWIGINNPELRIFDIIMETQMGTTYNSYLIDDEKVVIIDTVKTGYSKEFLDNIKSVIGDRKVDYVVVQHTELDHSGCLKDLLEAYPDICVVGSLAAIRYSKAILNKEFKSMEAKGDLAIGKRTLRFISAPNLHWPDSIFTYDVEDNALFTCDVMGCHYAVENCITDACAGSYDKEMKYYFDVIMGPFKSFVNKALDKIEDLNLAMIAPSHGPVHMENIEYYKDLYRQWAKEEKSEEKNIQIYYISAYGNTEKAAFYLRDKIETEGIKAEAHEITAEPLEELIDKANKASGILVGSPTINQDAVEPAWNFLAHVSAIINRGKAGAAFGSYGWSGEGVDMLTRRLKDLKFKVVEPGFKFNFVLSEEELRAADNFVLDYLKLIK